jgi:hypothetical protein
MNRYKRVKLEKIKGELQATRTLKENIILMADQAAELNLMSEQTMHRYDLVDENIEAPKEEKKPKGRPKKTETKED